MFAMDTLKCAVPFGVLGEADNLGWRQFTSTPSRDRVGVCPLSNPP